MATTRKAYVAGQFYPAGREELLAEIAARVADHGL